MPLRTFFFELKKYTTCFVSPRFTEHYVSCFRYQFGGSAKDKILDSVLGMHCVLKHTHTSHFVTIHWGGCDRKSVSVTKELEVIATLKKILSSGRQNLSASPV